jgi:hypothetical protein
MVRGATAITKEANVKIQVRCGGQNFESAMIAGDFGLISNK